MDQGLVAGSMLVEQTIRLVDDQVPMESKTLDSQGDLIIESVNRSEK